MSPNHPRRLVVNRRRLLLAASGVFVAPIVLERFAAANALKKVVKRSRALGTEVAITVLHGDRAVAEAAVRAAFDELEGIEDVMSLYRPDSALCRLNRERVLPNPDPRLVEVIRFAGEISMQSDGAFDITVQPLWEVYARAGRERVLPGTDEVTAARRKVDWRRVRLSPDEIRIEPPAAGITLNGIAQGWAADRVRKILAEAGIAHALVDCGEFSALGTDAAGAPWSVGIQHPREENAYLSVAKLSGRCLATSGDYATRFTDDGRAHHLFDPHTGRSPRELVSVTVAAPTAMEADALSTAIFVAGAERGNALIEARPGVDALIVLANGRTLATGGFPCDAG